MANVGLGRAEENRPIAIAAVEDSANGAGLDRVSDRRAGAVGFDVGNIGRGDAGAGADAAQHIDLCIQARLRDRAGGAVLVDGGGLDDRVNTVAVRKCIVQAPE